MRIDAKFFMHESDKIALQTLQSIPGFSQLFKAFMKIWSEKQYRIYNMSQNLRISEKQLSKYYNMLPPICKKLGIEVPELYLELDVTANAYTVGDTKPFIVMTSGLLETMPEELIPTVLAHECGHIACHHCLYTTMGRFILGKAINLLGLDGIAILPIQVAFAYWMRCSELSADRAAALCDGSAEKTVELCLRLAGFDKDISGEVNVEEFLNQAQEYQQMVEESAWDKTLEFMMLSSADHPMNAVRARECHDWANSDRFKAMRDYIWCESTSEDQTISAYLRELPMLESSKAYIGKNAEEVGMQIKNIGFENVELVKVTRKGLMVKPGQVVAIMLNGQDGFNKHDWYPVDAKITIEFYEAETEEEVAAAHPGQIRTPDSSKRYMNRVYTDVISELKDSGFTNFATECLQRMKKGLFCKEGAITRISINGQTQFEKGEWFAEDSAIRIAYVTYESEKSSEEERLLTSVEAET